MIGLNKSIKGFTLLEIMISVFILSVFFLGILESYSYINQTLEKNDQHKFAIYYAECYLENYFFIDVDEEHKAECVASKFIEHDNVRYNLIVEKNKIEGKNVDIKHIRVEVQWKDRQNNESRYELETMI